MLYKAIELSKEFPTEKGRYTFIFKFGEEHISGYCEPINVDFFTVQSGENTFRSEEFSHWLKPVDVKDVIRDAAIKYSQWKDGGETIEIDKLWYLWEIEVAFNNYYEYTIKPGVTGRSETDLFDYFFETIYPTL